ncbi:MAG: hypothetical protein H6Q41_304, partial [Deltaproteobacteria bacterium]|nr:hypothetical protein [Deltaproteobacteria bacterium]
MRIDPCGAIRPGSESTLSKGAEGVTSGVLLSGVVRNHLKKETGFPMMKGGFSFFKGGS